MIRIKLHNITFILFLLSFIFGYSCAPVTSLNPLSDPNNAVFDERLKGVWHYHTEDNSDVYLHIGKAADDKTLMLSIEHMKNGTLSTSRSIMFPTKINNNNYMNVQFDKHTDDIPADHLGYYFAKYDITNSGKLIINIMDTGKIIEAIEAGKLKGHITYRELRDPDNKDGKRRRIDSAKLTDSPKNISAFIKQTDDSILFTDTEKHEFEKLADK